MELGTLYLPDVVLCCVDCTDRLPWALQAMRQSMERVRFGDVVLLSDRCEQIGADDLPAFVRRVSIERLSSTEAYSQFMLTGLLKYLSTEQSHVLIIQWDGYVLHPDAWSNDFLHLDYIGAPWPHLPPPHNVGNGGFSLRSRRLLENFQEPEFIPTHPEDICIGVKYRSALEARGLRFADEKQAYMFSVEEGTLDEHPFGFHGPFHLPRVLDTNSLCEFIAYMNASALDAWWMGNFLREMRRADLPARHAWQAWLDAMIPVLPVAMCQSERGRHLCKALLRHGYLDAAAALLSRRRQAGLRACSDDVKLYARLAVLRLLGRGVIR